MTALKEWPKFTVGVQYSGRSRLNTLETCLPRPPSSEDSRRFWVVYVHGGAWRDPAISASSYRKTRDVLLQSSIRDKIAGYASINYRLSPYPSHPTDPSNPSDPARNAKHPDHINDILAAILYLQKIHHFGDRYVLVGHSCGATLALQVAMKRNWGLHYESTETFELTVPPPTAIVTLEGIYDIAALVKHHCEQPVYEQFIVNAFGESGWDAASPTSADFDKSWPHGKMVVLAHSWSDSLVEWDQVELQRKAFEKQGWEPGGDKVLKVFELQGDHDEVWRTGEAAKAIEWALRELSKRL